MISVLNKKKNKPNDAAVVHTGQVSEIPLGDRTIYSDTRRTFDLLEALNNAPTKMDAIDLIVDKTPDGKMALNTYLRIANQGVDIKLINRKTGRQVKKYDIELRDFCANMSSNTACGLDGVLDQLHGSAILHGGMAAEVVVNEDATDVENVIIIDPKTIVKYEWLKDKKRWGIYQNNYGAKPVDLCEGNFFWIPHQPKPGRPDGTLQFEPAIATMTQMYQLLKDALVVLNRIGFPKYDISIELEKLIAAATPEQLSDPEKKNKLLQETFNTISANMRRIDRDSSLVHYNSISVDTIGGGVNGSGIDVRAWFEMLEPLVVNSFQLTPVLMGRLTSGSYSLGTAEYRIVKDTLEVLRRNSKRMLENVLNVWARVRGYNVYAVVTHRPIEWQVEKERLEAELKQMEKARRAEEYKYISHEDASVMAMGSQANPQKEKPSLYEYISKNLAPKQPKSAEKTSQKEEAPDEEDT